MFRVALAVVLLFAIGALADPTCTPVNAGQLTFCFAVNYTVILDTTETPFTLDRLAQTLYLGQRDFGIEGGCNTEARNLICANVFRRCNETSDPLNPTGLKPCVKLCKDFKSCFKVEGDCDEFTYSEGGEELDPETLEPICTNVNSGAVSVHLALLAVVAAVFALMW